jgi:hypothetical protein
MKIILIAAALVAAAVGPALAAPKADHCTGLLQRDKDGLFLGPLPTDKPQEGVCVITNELDAAKVLQACPLGEACTVIGSAALCPDAGECVMFMQVTSVRRPK